MVYDLKMLDGAIRIQLLNDNIANAGIKLKSGRCRYWAGADVGLYPHIIDFCHGGDLLCLHDTASVANVRLKNVCRTGFKDRSKTIPCIDSFAECNWYIDVVCDLL